MKKYVLLLPAFCLAVVLGSAQTTILDFETPASSSGFQYFGSNLDGSLTQTIANPNPAGINTSSTVVQYVKPAVSQVWAGAFSTPALAVPIDLSNGGQVCVKVHMDHIGNLALKLEGSTSGQPDWIQKVSNTKVGEWEELCFDASQPSIETPFQTASGVYTTVVLFFDFGVAGTGADVTSYFDDIVVKSSGAPVIRTIDFQVDMNSYTASFDNVYLSGTFNDWSGTANPLTDANFDGIWEGSLQIPNGSYEYKVTLDDWDAQEEFLGTEECTKRDPSGEFVNRLLLVSADAAIPKFCFNSCYACGEEVTLTFRLGMGLVTPNPEGVWLAGGGNFDVPGGKYKMTDDNGDGIYDVIVPRKIGFQSFFTFANGPCADYSCKENLTGLSCGDPNNFNDRFLPAVQGDTLIATCFGLCANNALCTVGAGAPAEDVRLFRLLGNPAPAGVSLLDFGTETAYDKTVTLTNASGQAIGQWIAASGHGVFPLRTAGLPAGLYFVTVQTGGRFLTRELVIR